MNADGNCTIAGYINNLAPRAHHKSLYINLAALFSRALPFLESVYAYGKALQKQNVEADYSYERRLLQPYWPEVASSIYI